MFYWVMKHLVAGPVMRLLLRPVVTGTEHLPRTGGVIIASNHLSFVDPVILPLIVRRRVRFLAATSYFSGRSPGGRAVGAFLRATGMIPIDRSGGAASAASLQAGREVLGRGEMIGIYPEGGRSRDGKLHRGRTGIARIVLATGAPVVPVAMRGTDRVMPVGSRSHLPRFARVSVVFGPPMDFTGSPDRVEDHALLRSITDRIVEAIHRLSDQEFVDVYNSDHRAP